MIEHPVETATTLPDGSQITGLEDLRSYLVEQKSREFSRTIVVKLLTYALGRSLEFTDNETVDELCTEFEKSNYRLKHLITEIVCCDAFHE